MKNIVVVESPAKAKTIERILGNDFKVVASFGHVRDLPKNNLGVDVDHKFKPQYIIPTKARKTVSMLKKMFSKAKNIYLATDLDREGEAIAWHIVQATSPTDKQLVQRVVFPSITKTAVLDGMSHPREINLDLVDAQQARRVLDRLVGYKLSPLLWKKIFKGLSAGRVQSVALRLIVEREREIQNFKPEEYWSIEADFSPLKKNEKFRSKLIKIDDADLAVDNEALAKKIEEKLNEAKYTVSNVTQKTKKRNPYAPFITSTLQQDAYNKLGFSAKKTMLLAQKLYEGVDIAGEHTGLITYMRTDSRGLSAEAVEKIRDYIGSKLGKEYLPEKPNVFKKASKLAQEAHEAIRVTYPKKTPEVLASHLDKDMLRLYELIWKRTISCQMMPALYDATVIDIEGINNKEKYLFRSNGLVMQFEGFLKVWDYKKNEEDLRLPLLKKDDGLDLKELFVDQHFTEPPARFSEATLVKELEKNGVGRPSTYASIMGTIQTRGYVEKNEGRFFPKEVGFLVNDFLVKHFANIVDVGFTAKMENDLDEVALGKRKWVPVIKDFYDPFVALIGEKEKSINKEDVIGVQTVEEKCPNCGKPLQMKYSRFGKFLACTGFPDCKFTRPVDVSEKDKEIEMNAAPCEKCGGKMVMKKGRFGSFLACNNYPQCKNIRSLDKKFDIACPKCKIGHLVTKRSKRGKVFYGCDRYPDCDLALWNEPTNEKCKKCGFIMTRNKSGKLACENCLKNKKVKE